jgi:hypothetical protein
MKYKMNICAMLMKIIFGVNNFRTQSIAKAIVTVIVIRIGKISPMCLPITGIRGEI